MSAERLIVGQRDEVGLKRTGTRCTVPNAPHAKLMYYLHCMTNVLGADTADSKFVDYVNYDTMCDDEIDALLVLCITLSPDVLLNKCIFCAPQMCGEHGNEFFELSVARTTLAVSDTVVIGGQQRRVQKIMTFKMEWLENNYLDPLKMYSERMARIAHELGGGSPQFRAHGCRNLCVPRCLLLLALGCFVCSTFSPIWLTKSMLDGIKDKQAVGNGPLFQGTADQWFIGTGKINGDHFLWGPEGTCHGYSDEPCGDLDGILQKTCKVTNAQCGKQGIANAAAQAIATLMCMLALVMATCCTSNLRKAKWCAFAAGLAGLVSSALFATFFAFQYALLSDTSSSSKPVLGWGFLINVVAWCLAFAAARRLSRAASGSYLPL